MDGCMMEKQKRQMERCREGYIAGILNVQHMARVRRQKVETDGCGDKLRAK